MIVQRTSVHTLATCNPTREKAPRNKRKAKNYKLVLSTKEVKQIMSQNFRRDLGSFLCGLKQSQKAFGRNVF